MKRFLSSAVLAGIILLSGCEATELGGRAIIQAAAIDHDGHEYIVSALLFSSGGGSGGEIDPSNENVIKVTGRGETFAAAVDDISLTDGKEIYMSETRLLILGSGFSETDVIPLLETAARDMRLSLNTMVCCADDPELITDLHFTEGMTAAQKPVDMIENANRAGISPKADLLTLLNNSAVGRESMIPLFSPEQNGFGMTADEEGLTAVLTGARVLSGGRLTSRLDSESTAGAMLLSGDSDRVPLTFSHGGREHSCEAYCIKIQRLDSGEVQVSARLRRRNGESLPEELREAAMMKLDSIINAALAAE